MYKHVYKYTRLCILESIRASRHQNDQITTYRVAGYLGSKAALLRVDRWPLCEVGDPSHGCVVAARPRASTGAADQPAEAQRPQQEGGRSAEGGLPRREGLGAAAALRVLLEVVEHPGCEAAAVRRGCETAN